MGLSVAKLPVGLPCAVQKWQHTWENPVTQIHEQRTIAASPERVFAWLMEPANLTVSPWFRKAAWVDSSGPGVGATRELRGFGFWVHEQITAYDAPRSCSYRVIGGFPPADQNGTLTCTPADNGTHVDWVSGYKIPLRGGGKVLEILSAPLMRSLAFRAILAGCAKALES
jgi:uncharacterized protein YndB with AHSA1/START domain